MITPSLAAPCYFWAVGHYFEGFNCCRRFYLTCTFYLLELVIIWLRTFCIQLDSQQKEQPFRYYLQKIRSLRVLDFILGLFSLVLVTVEWFYTTAEECTRDVEEEGVKKY